MHAETPGELLRLAAILASAADGSPRWVARSRSVSTAYYAMFHAVAELCGRELVGSWTPWDAFRQVYRSLDHRRAYDVFKRTAKSAGASDDAKFIGTLFIELQESRHSADYDPGYRIAAEDLAILLERTQAAISKLFELPPADRKLLAARLIGRDRA